MSIQDLSQEKKNILADNSRVIWVSACPGSGKTKLFVERALNEIECNIVMHEKRGIAALSFTNLATDEIVKRLEAKGISTDFPNFIGTIDSFIQRFILQPFASSLGYCRKSGMTLIPEEKVNSLHGFPIKGISFKGGRAPGINEYEFVYKDDAPAYRYKFNDRYYFFTKAANSVEYDAIAKNKKTWWLTHGQLNHSDVKYLAAMIFKYHGEEITKILKNRFTTILVDECQDLGRLLQYIFMVIAKNSLTRCFFVGDFDQNLYEQSELSFPELLGKNCELKKLTLSENYRCPQKHCDFSLMFMESQQRMVSKRDNQGKIFLITHDLTRDYSLLYSNEMISNFVSKESVTAIISHRNSTLKKLSLKTQRECIFKSIVLNEIDSVSYYFERGEIRQFYILLQKILRHLLIDASPDDRQEILKLKTDNDFLEYFSWDLPQWKKILFDLLSKIYIDKDETWAAWRLRIMEIFKATFGVHFSSFNIPWGRKFQIGINDGCNIDDVRERGAIIVDIPSDLPILTVHKAKGLEFDNVIYFFPKPEKRNPCPVLELFEIGRYATWQKACYVGTTRAKENLVICLHKSVIETLRNKKPSFFDFFDEQIEL